jgi:hypothetical protein
MIDLNHVMKHDNTVGLSVDTKFFKFLSQEVGLGYHQAMVNISWLGGWLL